MLLFANTLKQKDKVIGAQVNVMVFRAIQAIFTRMNIRKLKAIPNAICERNVYTGNSEVGMRHFFRKSKSIAESALLAVSQHPQT